MTAPRGRRRAVHLQPRTAWTLIGTLVAFALLMGSIAADYLNAGDTVAAIVYGLVTLTALAVAVLVYAV